MDNEHPDIEQAIDEALIHNDIHLPPGIEPVTVDDDPACYVCSGDLDPADAPSFVALCDEHQHQSWAARAEKILRSVIPLDVQDAKPSGAHLALSSWTPPDGGLYLYGPTGAGKTHDAAAMTKKAWTWWMRKFGYAPTVAWITIPDFMDDMADSFGTSRKVTMHWRDADIVVLDDMGAGDDMRFAVRKLYNVIERRNQNRRWKVTMITSNYDLDVLGRDHLKDDRIPSRIEGMCAQVSYLGMPDRRSLRAPKLPSPE